MLLEIFLSIICILLSIYIALLVFYRKWFMQLPRFSVLPNHIATTSFSVIIPARNEAANIGKCLQSIINQNYPKHLFEIIVVDDFSTDETAAIVKGFSQQFKNIKLLQLQTELQGKKLNAYKKKAIEIAIAKSTNNWVITTDADCTLLPNWLLCFDDYIARNNSVFVAAPVVFKKKPNLVSTFQFIDFMAMQAITVAGVAAGFHSMCNGANLAYKKEAFYKVNGFKGIDGIASGDDMLLMNKIKKAYPTQIGYLFAQAALATTLPMPDFKSFINQRIRWASKSTNYDDKSLLPVLLVVYLLNLNLLLLLLLGLIYPKLIVAFVSLVLTKVLFEWYFLKKAQQFFGEFSFLIFCRLQIVHMVYIVVAGWLGKFGSYKWKDRTVH